MVKMPGLKEFKMVDKLDQSDTDRYQYFGQELGSVELQHAVQDVLPTIVQDVAVPMCQSEHSACCQLCLGIVTEQNWNVLNRLTQETAKNIYHNQNGASVETTIWFPGKDTINCLMNFSRY